MKRMTLAVCATLAATALAWAGPIEDRENLMKQRGGLTGQLSRIAKGETPFDAAATLDLLKQMQANADAASTGIDTLWSPDSQTGTGLEGKPTAASPKIWEDSAGFKAATDKFKADVDAAVAAAPADVTALQASFGAIAQNCGSCHSVYRIKTD